MKSTNQLYPCNPFPECEEKLDNNKKKKHKLKDKKGGQSELLIDNPSEKYFHIVNIDGCFEQANGEKINDYLIINCEDKTAFLVELKGGDFKTAILQLESGLSKVKSKLSDNGFSISGRIVLTNANAIKFARQNEILQIKNLFKAVKGDFDYKSGSRMELKL
jgi:hypothetical protein